MHPMPCEQMAAELPQLAFLEQLVERLDPALGAEVRARVQVDGVDLPLYVIAGGSRSPAAPALGLFGGVHGVERIGTEILLAFLHTLNERLQWETELRTLLAHVRLVVAPIVNPGGMWLGTRSNPRGVDLMRNAPVQASSAPTFLVGGHRISRFMPWYRGRAGAPMEPEARFLADLVRRQAP